MSVCKLFIFSSSSPDTLEYMNIKSHHPTILYAKFGLNWPNGIGESFELFFAIFLLSPLGIMCGPSLEQTRIPFTQGCFVLSWFWRRRFLKILQCVFAIVLSFSTRKGPGPMIMKDLRLKSKVWFLYKFFICHKRINEISCKWDNGDTILSKH